ncbi:MAG: metal ABC transporter solute-binding protein, Zn/Mn family [Gemmatimonadota bacterium]|jgi:zinc transport system substrate-binding protein
MIWQTCLLRPTLGMTLAALVFAGCSQDEGRRTPDPAAPPVIAVPLEPVAGLVAALAPDGAVRTVVLIPPGASPSTYQPAVDDLRLTATAALYLELGHPAFVFERTWLGGLLANSTARRVPIFADCPPVAEDYHVWVSSNCLGNAATVIASALRDLLPARAAEVDEALQRFRSRLAGVDSVATAELSPFRGRSFIVLHPAWGYLAREHGLTQMEILSHGSGDPGAARLAALIDDSRAAGIRTVYVQPQFNQAPARLIADELGAEVVSLDPLERDPVALIERTARALADGFNRETR